MATFSDSFNINIPSVALEEGEKIIVKFQLMSTSTSNFTASFGQGNLTIGSLAVTTGYSSTECPFFDSASMALDSGSNTVIFSTGISNFYDNNYIFVPNPEGLEENSLYGIYGDVDYKFAAKLFDIFLIHLSDGTFIEYRILQAYVSLGKLRLVLDSPLSTQVRSELANNTFKRVLLLTRIEDETNAYIIYRKRPGPTSYGFVVPNNLHPDVFENIDKITEEAKKKLIELGGVDGGVL